MLDDAGIERVLRSTRRIAVVGASSRRGRPSFGVFRSLIEHGYDCVPVNPKERAVLGVAGVPDARGGGRGDRPVRHRRRVPTVRAVVPHAHEAVAVGARCLWLQLGIVNWEAAAIAANAGLVVVMDRCTAIEVGRVGGRR